MSQNKFRRSGRGNEERVARGCFDYLSRSENVFPNGIVIHGEDRNYCFKLLGCFQKEKNQRGLDMKISIASNGKLPEGAYLISADEY